MAGGLLNSSFYSQGGHMSIQTLIENEEQRSRIAERAYELFLEEGCGHGNDLEHWLRAEQEILRDGEVEEAIEDAEKQQEKRKIGQKASRSK